MKPFTLSKARAGWRYWRALALAGLSFGLAYAATDYVAHTLVEYPIVVRTDSIDTGIYWLDTRQTRFERGEAATFNFHPGPDLAGRFAANRHTKYLLGLPGDTVWAAGNGALRVCAPAAGSAPLGASQVLTCWEAGIPQKFDSKGRALAAWLAPGHSHVLGPDEYWTYGPNLKSLDSRYAGPVKARDIVGGARPVWVWEHLHAPAIEELARARKRSEGRVTGSAVPDVPAVALAVEALPPDAQMARIEAAATHPGSMLAKTLYPGQAFGQPTTGSADPS